MATRVGRIWGKFDKITNLAILKLNYLAHKDSREAVEAPEAFITFFSANCVWYMRFWPLNLLKFWIDTKPTMKFLSVGRFVFLAKSSRL